VSDPAAELSFEQARTELERVVMRLEDGKTTLDEAIALWERGEALYRLCRQKLDDAELRIASLSATLDSSRPGSS
jgi:exodeoxyribonuclease VII small subunit